MDPKNRRKYPRFDLTTNGVMMGLTLPSRIPTPEDLSEARILNLSKNGACLLSPMDVAIGSYAMIIVQFGREKSVGFCRVMWKGSLGKNSMYGLFLKEWERLGPNLRRVLNGYQNAYTNPAPIHPEILKRPPRHLRRRRFKHRRAA